MRSWSCAAFAALVALASGAQAQSIDFSGRWSYSGLILSGRAATSFAQICDLKQTDGQLAGPCHGPNGGCSFVGVVSAGQIDATCRSTFSNDPALAGVSTFHGALAPDQIVRGRVTHSRFPGASGAAAMMRI